MAAACAVALRVPCERHGGPGVHAGTMAIVVREVADAVVRKCVWVHDWGDQLANCALRRRLPPRGLRVAIQRC